MGRSRESDDNIDNFVTLKLGLRQIPVRTPQARASVHVSSAPKRSTVTPQTPKKQRTKAQNAIPVSLSKTSAKKNPVRKPKKSNPVKPAPAPKLRYGNSLNNFNKGVGILQQISKQLRARRRLMSTN